MEGYRVRSLLLLSLALGSALFVGRGWSRPDGEPPLADAPVVRPPALEDPPTPAVSIRVRVPATVPVDQELEYRIVVENPSAAAAGHVVVSNPLPAAARFVRAKPEPTTAAPNLTWNLGTLKPHARTEITLVVKPTGDADLQDCARVSFDHGTCVKTRLVKPLLELRKSGPARVALYDLVTFKLTVTNVGLAEASEIVLVDQLPPGLDFSTSTPPVRGDNPLTWKLGKLPPGQSKSVEFQAIAKEVGSHDGKASVTAAGGLHQEVAGRLLVGEPKLTLTMSGPARRSRDQSASYRLTVVNTGTMTAAHVSLADTLYRDDKTRSGIEFIQASDEGAIVGNDVVWNLGDLAPGGRRVVEIVIKARQPGAFINVAEVHAEAVRPVKAVAETNFDEPVGLTLDVVKGDDPLPTGAETTWAFRLKQHGQKPASKAALTVTVPEGLTVVAAKGDDPVETKGPVISFPIVAELAPDKEKLFTVALKAEKPGLHRLKAEVAAAGVDKVVREETLAVADSPKR